MTKIQTFLSAKILTYRFNAYIDAQLAAELISYLKTGKLATKNTESSQRAAKYIKLKSKPSKKFLAGLAYTLYYGNGLANYLHTKNLEKLLHPRHKKETLSILDKYTDQLLETLSTDLLYQEFNHPRHLKTYWPQMVINSFKWVDDFIRIRDLPLSRIDLQTLKQSAAIVQHHNGQFNHYTAELLISDGKPKIAKVRLLKQAAQEFKHQQAFLGACVRTERAASKWDKLYTLILRRKRLLAQF